MAQAILGRSPSAQRPVAGFATRLLNLAWQWHFRVASRRQLARLDDHLLRDIGIDRATVESEILKPFWKS